MSNRSTDEMRARLTGLLAKKHDYRRKLRDLSARYKYVVFYGCGAIYHGIVASWRQQVGRRIDFCCDRDPAKWGKLFSGIRCISPDELTKIKSECAVFVTIGDFQPAYRALTEDGFPAVHVARKNALDIADFLSTCQPETVSSLLCQAWELLADKKSGEVFSAMVNYVLDATSAPETMQKVCDKHQYFPPDVFTLSTHERLVDIGAYNGDTIRDFVSRTQGRFDRIFAFEVDSVNFNALQANVQQLPERDRIAIYNLGIWDRECDITYSIGESQSTVGAAGEGRGHVTPLDAVLEHEKLTLVKMDIEGAEPQALRGACRTIQTQKPKLAICVYHDFRHLWEIPLYIQSLVPEYRIFLRHHTHLEYETVCYAVL